MIALSRFFLAFLQLLECPRHTSHRKCVGRTFMHHCRGWANHQNPWRRRAVRGARRSPVHKIHKRNKEIRVVANRRWWCRVVSRRRPAVSTCSHFRRHRQKTRHLTQYKPGRVNTRRPWMRLCIRPARWRQVKRRPDSNRVAGSTLSRASVEAAGAVVAAANQSNAKVRTRPVIIVQIVIITTRVAQTITTTTIIIVNRRAFLGARRRHTQQQRQQLPPMEITTLMDTTKRVLVVHFNRVRPFKVHTLQSRNEPKQELVLVRDSQTRCGCFSSIIFLSFIIIITNSFVCFFFLLFYYNFFHFDQCLLFVVVTTIFCITTSGA